MSAGNTHPGKGKADKEPRQCLTYCSTPTVSRLLAGISPFPWTPDDDLPPSSDFDFEPDWDAAFDRPFPEDREWWAQECDERERLELNPNFEPTTRIGTKWPAGASGST